MIEELYKDIKGMGFIDELTASGFFQNLKQLFFSTKIVYNRWYVPLDNFEFSTADFYQMIENELLVRKVPGLEITRVELSEGGPLSPKREYLRLRRERLGFDICAAPFGTSYFFSFRSVELPFNISILQLAVLILLLAMGYALVMHFIGLILGFLLFFVVLGGGIWFLRNLVALGLKDMDAALLKAPTIGPLYEVFFRKETYYREDTRAMYLSTVDAITKALVDEVTAAKGIKIAKRFERPISDELNRDRPNSPEPKATPAEQVT
jgi:hypothetical protein